MFTATCGTLKAPLRSLPMCYTPLLPPTQDVVHRRSRLKFLLGGPLFDRLDGAVVVAEAAALKCNILLEYCFSFPLPFASSVAQNGHGHALYQGLCLDGATLST